MIRRVCRELEHTGSKERCGRQFSTLKHEALHVRKSLKTILVFSQQFLTWIEKNQSEIQGGRTLKLSKNFKYLWFLAKHVLELSLR